MNKPFQRKGAKSNAHVGRDFEARVQRYFEEQGMPLSSAVSVEIGITGRKLHNFDLGDKEQKILVECKSHTWTETGNMPSAKMKDWNEAMYLFHATPGRYRKLFVVLRDFSKKRQETLAQYYIRTNGHLIPEDVEIWEFDETTNSATCLKNGANEQ